jgi:dTDP-4-dehydrorhamnose 3,5-epimerase
MKIIQTEIPDLLILEPRVFEDDRGYFFESYSQQRFEEEGLKYSFVQDNESRSVRGVIRGLHYQLAPFGQTKLIRVLEGRILDVALDIRRGSPTFGKWLSFEVSAENKRQILIPRGFAHGFSVLSEKAIFMYKCDNYYHPPAERGINFNDPALGIDWHIQPEEAIVSGKDRVHPNFRDADFNFTFG